MPAPPRLPPPNASAHIARAPRATPNTSSAAPNQHTNNLSDAEISLRSNGLPHEVDSAHDRPTPPNGSRPHYARAAAGDA
jgi:hypothetical protein